MSGSVGLVGFLNRNCKPKTMPIDSRTHEPLEPIGLILHENMWEQELAYNKNKLRANMNLRVEPLNVHGYYTLKSGFNLTEISFLPIKLNTDYWRIEDQIKLDARAKVISLNRLGGLHVSKPRYISADRLGRYVKYGIAQAGFDRISTTEEGLVVRDFMPSLDFLDIAGERFTDDSWIQQMTQDWSLIYQTGRGCYNDDKVYFLYGIKNLNHPIKTNVTGIMIKMSNVKTIGLNDMTSVDEYGSMFFQRPFLFKKGDDMVVLTKGEAGAERLKLLGFVVERLGDTIA